MKKSIWLALALLPALAFSEATLRFKSTTVDFGNVDSGKVVDILFQFENAGDDTLVIQNVIPACGCTTAALDKKEYAPGEKGKIASKFSTSGYSGKVIKTITVVSNDPASRETRLTLTGTVVVKDYAQADLRPSQIPFGAVGRGKTYVRKLVLVNLGSIDLRVLEVSCGPEVSLAFQTNRVAPGKATEIVLSFTPFDKGVFNTMVKIRTNDYRSPYIFVRLEAQVD